MKIEIEFEDKTIKKLVLTEKEIKQHYEHFMGLKINTICFIEENNNDKID
jgi:hypothetical protein